MNTTEDGRERAAEGPWFEELAVGDRFDSSPRVTLTDGLAAVHQSIVGDRLLLPLDHALAREVTGRPGLAHPALVWDVAIGQSTGATHHVRANLLYRGLQLRAHPAIGDTLHTTTEVVGLRQTSAKPGRDATGIAALRVTCSATGDAGTASVLDFVRCAMIPLRDPTGRTGHDDDLDEVVAEVVGEAEARTPGWDLAPLRARIERSDVQSGDRIAVVGGDVVSAAPQLARLTLNVARVHHDASAAGGRRLVYGGHTIGLALSHVTRALPDLVTVLAWEGCDHLAPVHEGDTLHSVVEVRAVRPDGDARVVSLRVSTSATSGDGPPRPVLDWRFDGLLP